MIVSRNLYHCLIHTPISPSPCPLLRFTMEPHKATVATIEANVRSLFEAQQPFRIYHGSTNSKRGSQRRLDNVVDTSKLNHVLRIDKETKTAIVEPNVPTDALLQATLEHDLVPPQTPLLNQNPILDPLHL